MQHYFGWINRKGVIAVSKNSSSRQPRQLVIYHAANSLPALMREMNFIPKRITVKRKKVRVLGGLFEHCTDIIWFDE